MSSVQGSGSTISPRTVGTVREILDELDGRPELGNLATAMRLREQLERNIKAPAAAAELVGQLSYTQRDVLREALRSLPTVKAFFRDAFERAPAPHDNVNHPDHGQARDVRGSNTTSAKINDGRTVDVAAIQGRLDEAPESAKKGARPRRRRDVEDAQGAAAQAQQPPTRAADAAGQPPSDAGAEAAKGPQRKRSATAPAATTAANATDAAANTDGATATASADQVAEPAGTNATDATTASGAPADVPRDIHQVLDDTLEFIKDHLSPQSDSAFREADALAQRLNSERVAIDEARQELSTLKAIPKGSRKPEQKKRLVELEDKLRGAPDLRKLENDFKKISTELASMPNRVGLLSAWFGVEKGRPALDDDTTEGKQTLMIFDELAGRNTSLPPDVKQRIAEFRKTDVGERLRALQPTMEMMAKYPGAFDEAMTTSNIATGNAVLDQVVAHVLGGRLLSEEDLAQLTSLLPPPPAPQAKPGAGAKPSQPQAAAGGGGPPNGPNGPNGPNPPDPPQGPSEPGFDPPGPSEATGTTNDKWFNPLNRNWFGLSRSRHDQLSNDGHHELLHAIQEYNHKTQTMHMGAATRLNSMMALLNSGLPIESILLMFMGMMTENEEEKLKLKMAEIVVAEQFERTNRKLQADQNFARDLVKKYDMGVERPEHRENINREQLEKMAGLTWTPQVTPEDAARSNARGNAFKTLRADGMAKLQEKLDKIQFKDGVLDADGLKELGLTTEDLKIAGISNQADLDIFKGQAEAHSPKYIEDLIGEKPIAREARFVDVTLNPMDFGFSTKPSQAIVQELQVQMQNYKQIMETFTAVIRMLQDIVARITQNIR